MKAHDDLDPLMAAVENGEKETVILLLDKGADVHSKTKLTTPVYIAQEKGHIEIKDILIQKGAPEHPGKLWQLRRTLIMRWQNLLCR